jgi:cytochrome d ubiquinol oxidase subunit I
VPAIAGNEAGWVAAEVGRQPFIVYPPMVVDDEGERVIDSEGRFSYVEELGLRTTNGVSKAIQSEQVLTSIVMFGLIYLMLGALWLFLLNRKIQQGPSNRMETGVDQSGPGDLAAIAGDSHLTGSN